MRMQRCLVALLGPAALGLGLGACAVRTTTMPETSYPPPGGYARAPGAHVEHRETVAVGTAPTEYYTESYPPEPLYETVTPSPDDGHVWIDGSWHWNGYEWVWIGGSWVPEPVDLVYIEPHYAYQDDSYVYRPGHWTRHEHIPRGVIVRDHRRHRPVTGHYPRPERPHYRLPGDDSRHGHRPPHASPDRPGTPLVRDHRTQHADNPGTPPVRDHRMPHAGDPGNGAPPPRTGPPPRHQGPDQAGPPTVPRRPLPDISSPASRGVPASRPRPGFGPPPPRTAPTTGIAPGAPPRTGPRITPRYTPPAPPPRGVPGHGGPPPRTAPGPRDHRNFGGAPPRTAPGPRDHRNPGAPPPRTAPAPRGVPGPGAPPPRTAPGPRDHRGRAGNVSGNAAGPVRPQRPTGMPARRR